MALLAKTRKKKIKLNNNTLKCRDPYYDVDTRHLKNKMDLSQELHKPQYKDVPVKDWKLRKKKYFPCRENDFVRLVDNKFCCEPAQHRRDILRLLCVD